MSGGNGSEPAPAGAVAEDPAASASKDVEAAIQEEEQDVTEPPAPPQPASPQAGTGEAPAYASPAVRRLARELGVDLSTIRGTGRKGRITKDDVRKPQPREAASRRRRRPRARA